MTRINLVPPRVLIRQHLLAEYRELPRIFGLVQRAQLNGRTPSDYAIPPRYLLGRGHMLFFYDKCTFLVERQRLLIEEMDQRGYAATFRNPEALVAGLDAHWLGSYVPRPRDIKISRERIQQRMTEIMGRGR